MIFALAILVLWLAGFAFLYRIPLCSARETAGSLPSVSVIVPARNEEDNLPALLQSLQGQSAAPHEIIVVDDGSTDGTAEIAHRLGARVVASKPLPDGWRGKTWACYQGAQAATGKLLLFVDADTSFESDGLRRVLGTWTDGEGVISAVPFHGIKRPYEEFSAFFNLIMTAGTGAFTVFGRRLQPFGLFGQFLLMERSAYFDVGGHEAVKEKVLENFYLADVLRRRRVLMRCFAGKGVISMRMYPHGLRELVDGWSKAFASGAAQTPLPLLLTIIVWITGSMLALVWLALGLVANDTLAVYSSAVLYLLFALQVRMMLTRIGSFSMWTAALYPVPLVFYFVVFTRSLINVLLRRSVSWKGRSIDALPREK